MSSRSPSPSSIAVVAILAEGEVSLDNTVEAVAAQTYEPAAIYVVGKNAGPSATALGVPWRESMRALLPELDPFVTHVWMLAGASVPGPNALHALIMESERVGADIAGSKLLALEHPDRLISVGIATDVFDVPYIGLDEDELDAGQYDVVRDVAAVAAQSILGRRDLLRGLGGPDKFMAPVAAAVDLSQRARSLGARVVVVPSSEVAVPSEDPAPAWREEAGRIRAMIKVYSLVTLLWALPLRFLIGMIEALAAPLVGRWTLLIWLRSWLWNVGLLPSTIGARRALRKNAVVGDAELFRYQLRGSAALKSIWSEIVDAARIRFPVDDGSGIGSIAKELKTPAFALGVTAVLFGLLSTRQIWSGFPAGRFSLPLPPRGADAVAAYAGGWNPAGFGSPEQLPPFVGLAGVWQQVLFDNPDLAAGSLVLAAFLGGIWGMVRLLQTWSVGTVAGILAGVALMAGPAARTIAGSGDAPTLIGLGVVPWVVLLAVAPWPAAWLHRLGRLLAAGSVTGLMANLSPELIVLPVAALLIKVAVDAGAKPTLIGVAVAGTGGVIAPALLRPWVGAVDLDSYLGGADAYWVPGTLLLAAASIAALAVVLAAPGPLARLGAWGALVAAAGGLVARTASEGGGRHVAALGLAAVALGTAVVVGAALEAARNREATVSTRSLLAIGGLAGLLVVASSVLILAPGRAGLPGDDLAAALRFTGASVEDSSSARVLLVGPPESLPGTSRRVRGAAYRVVSAPMPALWELDLPSVGPADEALEAVLESVIDGGAFRAGEQLADFGIRWILEMGETPLSASFVGQLDLIPLDGLRRPAFLVDSERAVRAISLDGDIWNQAGTGYEGAPSAAVLVRESADLRWGPDGETGDWAMTLDGSSGVVEYEPRPGGSQAIVSLWGGLGMLLASAVLRRRR